ncbi:hypothetical protein LJR289_005599 [Pseudoduganella sp. LjRoot289]|uniref:hypothetical protein n=1 Tax=Pseudoduganella sp. LjRoot289 TaxID=3342314 RepID=UPI003ED0BF38
MAGRQIAAAAILAMAAGTVLAEDSQPMFKVTGFSTLGIAYSSMRNADFVSNYWVQPNGVGKTRDWSTSVDSRAGAQVNAKLSNELSAVVQIVSEQRWDNSYRPFVEWASLKYAFTPDFSVRAGRVLVPTFMWSESRKVGYTNPWIRPPVEVYNLLVLTNNDGVDATYRSTLGGVKNSATLMYGQTKNTNSGGAKSKFKQGISFSDTIESGNLTARLGYVQTKMDMPALAFLNAFGCTGCESDVPLKVATAGFSYDASDWFVMAEGSRSTVKKRPFDIGGVRTGAYLTGGVRLGAYTPYLTYGQMQQTAAPTVFPANPQQSASLGLRWDFMRNADIKVQYDHIRPGAGSTGLFINASGAAGGNVLSTAVDFVF